MFRPAERADAVRLWYWRLEAEAEGRAGGWYEGRFTAFEDHELWLENRLALGPPVILIWEEDGTPKGQIRVESNGELSFFVPRAFRADGVAQRMLRATHGFLDEFGGRIKATVDAGNFEAWEALRLAGFREYPVKFLAYKR